MKRASRSVLGQPRPLGEQREIAHLSYSTLTRWFDCPKQVELDKVMGAPKTPAWWFAGGSAVHAATEAYDRWTLLDVVGREKFSIKNAFEYAFAKEVAEISEKEPDRTKWRHAGPKTAPETLDRWMKLGPLLVGNYIKWRRIMDYQVWHGFAERDGVKQVDPVVGIEIDLSCTLPGCEREIKQYADRIFYSPSLDQIHIIDLKTGTRGPRTALQFGVYRAGLEFLYGVKASTGAAFMNREGDLGKAFDLSKYTPDYVGRMFGHLSRAVDTKVFPAHQGSSCFQCDVQSSCYINGGELSAQFDPDDPDYPPF